MSTQLSTIFASLQQQQFPALINLLEKGREHVRVEGGSELELIEQRLVADMHPLRWQVQTVLELALRSAARVTEQKLPSLEINDDTFDGLIEQVKKAQSSLAEIDGVLLDANSSKTFDIPIGPEASITLTGEDYVLKFFLPNLYFHLTTTYNLLRMVGVPVGKRDFMGPVV